jgi:hypothetical protein
MMRPPTRSGAPPGANETAAPESSPGGGGSVQVHGVSQRRPHHIRATPPLSARVFSAHAAKRSAILAGIKCQLDGMVEFATANDSYKPNVRCLLRDAVEQLKRPDETAATWGGR